MSSSPTMEMRTPSPGLTTSMWQEEYILLLFLWGLARPFSRLGPGQADMKAGVSSTGVAHCMGLRSLDSLEKPICSACPGKILPLCSRRAGVQLAGEAAQHLAR